MDMMQPSTMPGSGVSAGPLGHDYWKRAVYRAAPRGFSVEMLPPAKMGSSYSFGIRVHPAQFVQSSGATIRSTAPMSSSYEIWRKWEDCLWFQDTLELQYSMLSRQKRQRLLNGKGIKKNGIYIQDQASSWESLPPGPDPKSVKKDIHDYLPRLTKRGTLFRTSAATIDQRHAELSALVKAFLADDVPALIEELREDRTIRDFFGYWRRDHDLLIKRNPPRRPNPEKSRKSLVASINPWPAHFPISSPSLDVSADAPPSPTHSTSSFAPGSNSSAPPSSDSGSSASSDMPPSPRTSVQLSPGRRSTRGAPTEASFSTTKSRAIPNMNVVTIPPPSHQSDILSQTQSGSSFTASSRPRSHSAPQKPKVYDVSEDFPLFLSASTRDSPSRPVPPGTVRTRVGGLEALPEEQEHELSVALPSIGSLPSVGSTSAGSSQSGTSHCLQRRPRAHSLAAASHRTIVVCDETFAQPDIATDSSSGHNISWSGHESDANPGLSSSAATLSTLSLQSHRSSWLPSSRSRPSSAESAESATSAIDVDLSGLLFESSPELEARRQYRRSKVSIMTVDSVDAVIPRYSSGPSTERHGRPRSNSQPLPSRIEDSSVNADSWMELGDDFIDAYFDQQGPHGDAAVDVEEDDTSQELVIPSRVMDVPHTAIPPTPHEPIEQTIVMPECPPDVPLTAVPPTPALATPLPGRRQHVAISLSPELFSQPFRDTSSPGVQYHLPFTPSPQTPDLSPFPSSPAFPAFLSTPPADDAIVIKAARDDAIVSFRLPRSVPLADARTRIADKFSHTEGVMLAPDFAIAYVPPVGGRAGARETLVRASTASASTTDWSRQARIESEEDWAVAAATCGRKLVLRVVEPAVA